MLRYFSFYIYLDSVDLQSTSDYDNDFLTEEEWTEKMFLVLASSILVLVMIVTISAIIYVIVSNRKLKHYSTFITGNDGASSLESSLKRCKSARLLI